MTRTIGKIAAGLAGLASTTATAQEAELDGPEAETSLEEMAEEEGVTVSLRTDFATKYILYGIPYSEEPAVQETLTVSLRNFSISGFTNYDIANEEINETDVFVNVFHQVNDNLSLYGGWALYHAPTETFKTTQEIYGGISVTSDVVDMGLLAVHDIDEYGGLYAQAAVSRHFDLFEFGKDNSLGLDIEGLVGFNNDYYRDGTGLSHLEGRISLPINIGVGFTVTPNFRYQHPLDKDFGDHAIFGVSAEARF